MARGGCPAFYGMNLNLNLKMYKIVCKRKTLKTVNLKTIKRFDQIKNPALPIE